MRFNFDEFAVAVQELLQNILIAEGAVQWTIANSGKYHALLHRAG